MSNFPPVPAQLDFSPTDACFLTSREFRFYQVFGAADRKEAAFDGMIFALGGGNMTEQNAIILFELVLKTHFAVAWKLRVTNALSEVHAVEEENARTMLGELDQNAETTIGPIELKLRKDFRQATISDMLLTREAREDFEANEGHDPYGLAQFYDDDDDDDDDQDDAGVGCNCATDDCSMSCLGTGPFRLSLSKP